MGSSTPEEVALRAEVRQLRERIAELGNERETALGQAAEEHERLLAEVRSQQALLDAVIEHLPLGIGIAEAPSGRLLRINERTREIWALDAMESSDAAGYGKYAGFHADGRRYSAEDWQLVRALKGEVIRGEEIDFIRGDGAHRVMRSNAGPVRDGEGRVVAAVVVIDDITERKRAEEALLKAEFEMALILDNANEIIAYHDTGNNLVWANKAYLESTGLPLSELKGRKCYCCWGLDRMCDHCPVVTAIQTGEPHEGELSPENQPHWPACQGSWLVKAAPVRDSTGSVIGAIEVAHDITERKRSEQALRESEERFRSVAENMSEGLMIFDAEGNFTYQNPASLRIHGFGTPEAGLVENENLPATWKGWDDTGRPMSFEEWPISRVLRGECFQNQILRATRVETGQEFYASYNGCPIFDANGRFIFGFITIREITKRRKAETALRESEGRYRTLFESIEEMVTTYTVERDANGQIVERRLLDANPAFLRAAGVTSVEKIRGKTASQVFGEAWAKSHLEPIQQALATGQPQVQEVLRPEDGRHYITTVVPLTANTYLATGRDITARKHAEMALRESEERFRLAQQAAGVGTFELNIRTGVNTWTPELEKMYGLSPHGFSRTQQTWENLVHPEDRAVAVERVNRSLDTGEPTDGEWRVVWPDGSIHWLTGRWRVFKDADGSLLRMIGVNIDITERKQAEEALREGEELQAGLYREARREIARRKRVEQELRRSNADLEQFAFAISHDLRSPLNAITSYAAQLKEEYQAEPGSEAETYLTYLTGAAARLRKLILDLLVYSRVATPEGDQPSPKDSQDALRAAELNLQECIRETGAILTCGPLPQVEIATGLLTQVFQNLLENAIKFRGKAVPTIHVSAEQQGESWLFCVADNGIGIDPQHLDQVFRIFKRLHGDTYEGTGIGLAVCRKIVERQGGRIWVESAPGQGAKFYFALPATARLAQAT